MYYFYLENCLKELTLIYLVSFSLDFFNSQILLIKELKLHLKYSRAYLHEDSLIIVDYAAFKSIKNIQMVSRNKLDIDKKILTQVSI